MLPGEASTWVWAPVGLCISFRRASKLDFLFCSIGRPGIFLGQRTEMSQICDKASLARERIKRKQEHILHHDLISFMLCPPLPHFHSCPVCWTGAQGFVKGFKNKGEMGTVWRSLPRYTTKQTCHVQQSQCTRITGRGSERAKGPVGVGT